MATHCVLGQPGPSFHWLDVVDPTREELEKIAQNYGLHATSVQDCLDPEHLPKFEQIGDVAFVIVRAFDEACSSEADTVQELTRKVAFFVGQNFLITVHRIDQPFMVRLRERWKGHAEVPLLTALTDAMGTVLNSFEVPIEQALARVEALETQIFRADPGHDLIEEAYFLKRKASVMKRVLRLSLELLPKISGSKNGPFVQDLKDSGDRLFFYAEELFENVNILVNLHVSLSSQRTNEASHRANEVMRLLTVFSVFFMPLNFIAGLYGMNFHHMPELQTPWGYPIVLVSMAAITIGIFVWFRRKGWM